MQEGGGWGFAIRSNKLESQKSGIEKTDQILTKNSEILVKHRSNTNHIGFFNQFLD